MRKQKQPRECEAQLLPILADHLIVEILSWLPVKSLIRFRCVSKSWNSLIISDSQFTKLHLQRSSTPSTKLQLLIDSPCLDSMVSSWPVTQLLNNSSSFLTTEGQNFSSENYNFIGSCNGLIALHGTQYRVGILRYSWVCFWNPAIRTRSQNSPSCFGLTGFGFGYDPISDTYKVVGLISCSVGEQGFQRDKVKVYSRGGNCWRVIVSFPDGVALERMNGVYVNGTLNLVAFRYNSDNIVNQVVIVSLHLRNEMNVEFPLPNLLDHEAWFLLSPTLWVLKDCLHVSRWYKKVFVMLFLFGRIVS
ncbi:hypothetical protein RJT34_15992 [Clitoria ternatea]|uniref:F-box domain-containing protein n=1 Tax=Clitoria ternatea TaxID=43366 RepID=A0AAN9J7W8_CLITE